MKKIGLILGQLIIERINTIFFGWNDEFYRPEKQPSYPV